MIIDKLYFAKVRPNAIIPTKEDEDAGYDIYAYTDDDYIVLAKGETKAIPTGIACAVSDDYYLQVQERGSTGIKAMKYGAGVIDSGFRGEINIILTNCSEHDIIISKLSKDELIEKHGVPYCPNSKDIVLRDYISYNDNHVWLIDYDAEKYGAECVCDLSAKLYPYDKAIAQLIVHKLPKMDVEEISYEELKSIPSKRGIGMLGSSGK